MNPLGNPFAPDFSPVPQSQKTETRLGPVGAKLRDTLARKQGLLRAPLIADEEFPEARSVGNTEELAVMDAYQHRDELFDTAKELYQKLASETLSISAPKHAAQIIAQAQKEAGLDSDPFIEFLKIDVQERPWSGAASLALGEAYVATGRYDEADLHYNTSVGPPIDHQKTYTWLDLYDAITKDPHAKMLPDLTSRLKQIIWNATHLRDLTYIDRIHEHVIKKLVDISKRLPSPAIQEAMKDLFAMLEAIPVPKRIAGELRNKADDTLLRLTLLELRAGRLDQATKTYHQIRDQVDRVTAQLAFAQNPQLPPKGRKEYLALAKQDILSHPSINLFGQLVTAAPEDELPIILATLKAEALKASHYEYRIGVDYEILKGALHLQDHALADWCFDDIEQEYRHAEDRRKRDGHTSYRLAHISATYLRASFLMQKQEIEPALSDLMDTVILPDGELGPQWKLLDNDVTVFSIVDIMIERGLDAKPFLQQVSKFLEQDKFNLDPIDGSEKAQVEIIKRYATIATQECREIARKKEAILKKTV